MSNDTVRAALIQALEPYCQGYCNDPARLEVNVEAEFVNAHLFLSTADRTLLYPGPITNHLRACFDLLGKQLGEGRERLGMDFPLP